MSRRALSAVLLAVCLAPLGTGSARADGASAIAEGPRDIPVVDRVDVAVAGGGLAGYTAALYAAEKGLSVVLVEVRNHLGHEYTTTYKTEVGPRRSPSDYPLARAVFDHMEKKGVVDRSGAAPLKLLAHLPAHSTLRRVKTYLFSLPVGAVVRDGRVCGLLMANRVGRQAVLAKVVIDATDDARVAADAGAELVQPGPGPATVRRFIAGAAPWPPGPLAVPRGIGLDGDQIVVHRRGVEIVVRMNLGDDRARGLSKALCATLDKAFRLRDDALGEGKTWEDFAVAPEVLLDETPRVACRAPLTPDDVQTLKFDKPGALVASKVQGLVLAGRNCLPQEAGVDLQTLLCLGEAAGQVAVDAAGKTAALPAGKKPEVPRPERTAGLSVREIQECTDRGTDCPRIRRAPASLPVAGQYDVLVVGGGTSGALAAIAAARQGARVAMVEVLPNLGGTSSNRVTCYYWGVTWKSRLSDEIDQRIRLMPRTDATGNQKVAFSGEDKKLALQDIALASRVELRLQTFAAGAVMRANKVAGAVVENAAGRSVLLAGVVIDATGHADVAAAAGAAFDKGRPTDGFMHEVEHGPLRDSLDVADMSKVYLRMPGKAPSHNLRESRRIVGDYTLTMADEIHSRRFADTVCRWRSNYDSHFPHSPNETDLAQDWMAILGLFRRPIEGSIPYRCLLPKGLENILVVGKAYSVTHDGLIGPRMQRDLQHLGEAAGVAAAMACRAKTSCREVPVGKLQAELVRLGVLRPEDIAVGGSPHAAPVDLQASVRRLGTDEALDGMVELYLAGPQAAPRVRPLLKSEDARVREEAALVLGLLGDRSAVPLLREFLEQRNNRTFAATQPRSSSIASVPLYCSAVILLGRFGDADAARAMRALLAERQACPANVAAFTIAALGRIGDRQAIGVIRPYLALRQPVTIREENREADAAWGVATTAARVLARLGDRSGVPALIGLLDADQSLLRDYALRLLEEITGQRLGKDRSRWEAWWSTQPEDRIP